MRRVAGFGFRKGAKVDSLLAALSATGLDGLTHVATVESKHSAACMVAVGERLGVPVVAIDGAALATANVATQSEKSVAMYGTGSVSEAAALIAAGTDAVLLATRMISPDKMATCAVAECVETVK